MESNHQDALALIAQSREAVLATLEEGKPFTSSANYLYFPGKKWGEIVVLVSSLARHTKNIQKNPNVSLQIVENTPAPLYQRKRVSLQGEMATVKDPAVFAEYRKKYLEVFPESQIFFTLSDFNFYKMEISGLYFIGGFGKIESIK